MAIASDIIQNIIHDIREGAQEIIQDKVSRSSNDSKTAMTMLTDEQNKDYDEQQQSQF